MRDSFTHQNLPTMRYFGGIQHAIQYVQLNVQLHTYNAVSLTFYHFVWTSLHRSPASDDVKGLVKYVRTLTSAYYVQHCFV